MKIESTFKPSHWITRNTKPICCRGVAQALFKQFNELLTLSLA